MAAEVDQADGELYQVPGLAETDPVTLDLDSTTTRAHSELKEEATCNEQGTLSFSSLLCSSAERSRVLLAGAQPVGWGAWIRWEMLGPRSTVNCTVQYRSAASRIARCTASVPPVVSHSWVSSKP